MTNYPEIVSAFYSAFWAIMPEKLEAIRAFIDMKARGGNIVFEGKHDRPTPRVAGTVAIIPLFGTISPRANMLADMSGGTSADVFGADMARLVADPSIDAIVADIDSPGGAVQGMEELHRTIMGLRGTKPLIAQGNFLIASGAYWAASAFDEIVATPSAEVGSIGVIGMHRDVTAANEQDGVKVTIIRTAKHKNDVTPFEPISDETLAFEQQRAQEYHDTMVGQIAKGRGLSKPRVDPGFGEGRVYGAKAALERGMIDQIATLGETVARLQRRTSKSGRAMAMQVDVAERS